MKVAVTGASGALGRATADLVLQAVEPRELVLTTRRPELLADFAERGAEVRRVDFDDPSTLSTAFVGVDRVLMISTDAIGARLNGHRAAISAATDAGVQHVVYTSVPEPVPANPALVVADHAGTEQALHESGLHWTILRNNLYAHLQLPGLAHAIASGRFLSNGGSGATAYVTRADCAAAAAAALVQDGHEGRTYDVSGPQALTAADLVALARDLGGRDVELVDLSDSEFMAALRAAGQPEEMAALVTSFGAATRGDFFANVSSAVAELTSRPPTPLADVLQASLRS